MAYLVFLLLFLMFLSFVLGIGVYGFVVLLFVLAGAGFAVYGIVVYAQKKTKRERTRRMNNFQGASSQGQGDGDEKPAREKELHGFSGSGFPGSPSRFIPDIFAGQGGQMDRFFVRGLIIAAITLALLVPLSFVSDMVDERSYIRRSAIEGIAESWGGVQRIAGPILVIPYQRQYSYTEVVKDENKKNVSVTKTGFSWENKVILPAKVNFDAALSPQIRYRSIYEYVVYSAPIHIDGTFRLPTTESFGEDVARIDWHRAWFAVGVGDLKGITSETPLLWEKKPLGPYHSGTGVKNLVGPGFHTGVPLDEENSGREQSFSLVISLNGSGGLYFTPVGETTRIHVAGNWPHPSFTGNLLPTSRAITDSDFEAEWVVPHLSRTYPQSGTLGKDLFTENSNTILSFTAGLDLFETVSLYTQAKRAVKYGILFIGLTFVALFAFELVTGVRMHFLQYGLVGISMTVFYLVLLSLAEHTNFITAFTAASVITVCMNSLYIATAHRSRVKGLIMAVLLMALYILLYALLRMEDHALLIGTGIVLLALGVLMFLTRNLPVAGSGDTRMKPGEKEVPG